MKTSYVTVKTVEDQEIIENKKNNLDSEKLGSEEQNQAKRQVEKDGGIVFDRDTDGQEQRWPGVNQELQEQEAIAETASKLADGARQRREEDLDGHDEALKL